MSVEWKRLCLTTAGCHESRFRIIMFNEISNIQLIKSWTIGDGQFQVHYILILILMGEWSFGEQMKN